jgi:hypothetical protein
MEDGQGLDTREGMTSMRTKDPKEGAVAVKEAKEKKKKKKKGTPRNCGGSPLSRFHCFQKLKAKVGRARAREDQNALIINKK